MIQLYNSKTYIEDIDTIIVASSLILLRLKDKSILITGATGLICSALADLLFRYNELYNADIHILIAARDKEKTLERFSRYKDDFSFIQYNAAAHNDFSFYADYIIHGASNAAPCDFTRYPIDTMLDNFMALYELLSYMPKLSAILYISSSEIYGKRDLCAPWKEDDYGYIDILNTRSSYSSSKRAAETLCSCFTKEYNLRTVIARPGHIYGPTARVSDDRVSSQFAYAAASGKDIILKSAGNQLRSYCYVFDTATALLYILLDGKTAEAYNISNPLSIITIRQMAEYIARYSGVSIVSEITDDVISNPMLNSSLNADKLLRLGWKPLFNASEGFAHTIQIFKEIL